MGLKKQKGFTLLELMIVIAIIGILAAVTIPRYGSMKDNINLRSAAKRCMLDIRYAQQLSMDTKDKHGVFFTNTGYEIRNIANAKVIKQESFKSGTKYILGSLQTDAVVFGSDGTPYQMDGTNVFINVAEIDIKGAYENSFIYIHITPRTGELRLSLSSDATAGEPIVPPEAPTGLTALAGNNKISLTWTAPENAAECKVKRSINDGGPYTEIKSGVTTSSYIDTSVVAGTKYYYVVTAVNSAGESISSNQASAVPTAVPDAPANLTAVPGNNRIDLDWTASANAISYNVKRNTNGEELYSTIKTGVTASSYTDTTAINGTTYYYVVTAVNTYGEGANSNQISATPSIAPAPPNDLIASPGDGEVYLSWTASPTTTSYILKRGISDGGPYTTTITGITDTFFTDTTAVNGTTYYYIVTAVNAMGESGSSNQTSAMPEAGVQPPIAPVNLTALPTITGISLGWSVVAEADTYNIKRSISAGGPYTIIASGLTLNSYKDTAAAENISYYYVVSATNLAGESPDSAEANAAIIISTTILYPSADAYVNTSNKNKNFGTETSMYFQGDASNTYRSYIKFDLSSIPGTIIDVNLRVYSNGNAKVCEYPDNWTETGIVAHKAPDPATWVQIGSFEANWVWNYYETNVTDYSKAQLAGDKIASFALLGTTTSRGAANTRESTGNKPELVIRWMPN